MRIKITYLRPFLDAWNVNDRPALGLRVATVLWRFEYIPGKYIHVHVPRVAGIRIKTQGGIEVQILTDWANSSQPLTRDARLECEAFPATEPMLI